MAAFRTGDPLVWIIGPILDDSGVAVTGGTQATVKAIKPGGTFSPTFAEISDGLYQATVVGNVRGLWALYSTVTKSGVVYPDFGSITVDDELAYTASGYPAGSFGAIISSLNGLNAGNVTTTTAPIAVGGKTDLYQKTDYHAADGRAIPFDTDDAGTWPDLTGATVTLSVDPRGADFGTGIEKTGDVITPTGATKLIQFELDAADTENVPVGLHPFQVRATLASGAAIPLATGRFNIIPYIYGAFD